MKKCLFLFLMVFLMTDNVWSKPILEIASYQDGKASERLSSAMSANTAIIGDFGGDLKENLKKWPHMATNIETRFYVDDKGFVVVGESESIPGWILARIGKNDLLVNGNLFVNGSIDNSDDLKAEISALKRDIAELKAEIRALRK